jgi:hypothetical protein
MDDRHAQFLIVVADACAGAALGDFIVEMLTRDDMRYRGVPVAVEGEEADPANGGTVQMAGSVIALEDVVELVIRPPARLSVLEGP